MLKNTNQHNFSPPPRKMADSEVRMDEETTTTESSVLIVARKDKKPTNDGQTKMDANKPEKRVDFVQADQKPLADENINGERKVRNRNLFSQNNFF